MESTEMPALETYLAYLQDEATSERYTQVTTNPEKLSVEAAHLPAGGLKRYDVPTTKELPL